MRMKMKMTINENENVENENIIHMSFLAISLNMKVIVKAQ